MHHGSVRLRQTECDLRCDVSLTWDLCCEENMCHVKSKEFWETLCFGNRGFVENFK